MQAGGAPDRSKKKAAYYVANREIRIAYQKKWAQENLDKKRAANRKWQLENPENMRSRTRNRAARLRNAEGSHTAAEILNLKGKQQNKCACCGASIENQYEVDHIMPLALGGSNWISNIQLLCRPCNRHKSSKAPSVWAKDNGMPA